jgi:hypothetical protein
MTQNLGQIIELNGGIFSRAQALDCGEKDRTLAAAVREGVLVRLRRGFYAPADIYAAASESRQHVLHARAALAGQRGRVALTGVSAAALHGFDIYDTSLDLVHLVRLDNGSTRTEAGIVHHGTRHSDFYWDDFRHLGEFDGKIKYQKLLRRGETPSDCVFREKRREDAMRADSRGMSRFVWADVMPRNARRSMVQLRAALDQSRRLYVRGRTIIAS